MVFQIRIYRIVLKKLMSYTSETLLQQKKFSSCVASTNHCRGFVILRQKINAFRRKTKSSCSKRIYSCCKKISSWTNSKIVRYILKFFEFWAQPRKRVNFFLTKFFYEAFYSNKIWEKQWTFSVFGFIFSFRLSNMSSKILWLLFIRWKKLPNCFRNVFETFYTDKPIYY